MRTKMLSNDQNPKWHVEFWLPLHVPSFGQQLQFKLRDWNSTEADVTVCQWVRNIDPLLKVSDGAHEELHWLHCYGLNLDAKSAKYSALSGTVNVMTAGMGASAKDKELQKHEAAYHSEWQVR